MLTGCAVAATSDAPEFVAPEFKEPPKGTRVLVYAEKLAYDGKSDIATATGLVRITYGPYTLTATKVVYDRRKGLFKANGSVELREPNGNILQADLAEMNDKFKEGFAEHVRALLTNDVTITANYARRYENGITVYENVSYTACKSCVDEGGTPLWQILSRETTHDQQQHTLYYRDATLEIAGVPVFWTPYFSYPDPTVKRRSGWLIPQGHYGEAYGFGVSMPYFWAVKPNADLTVTPRLTSGQGLVADAEWRHRLNNGIYSLRGYGLYELSPGRTDENSRWRGALTSTGDFRLNDTWTWGWDGTLVSDRAFLNEYDYDSRDMAVSSVNLTGLSGRNYTKAQALHYRTLLTGEDQDLMPVALPYVTSNYIFDQQVLGGELGFNFNAYSLRRGDPDPRFDLGTEQTRAVASLDWRRQFISNAGMLITPFTSLRSDVYMSENVPGAGGTRETSSHLLPSAGIDLRWPLIADHGFAQSVMTPVFQIISSSNERDDADIGNEDAITLNFDHTNLFLADRFSGLDRYEGGTRVNLGVIYNLYAANGGFVRASMGESFHVAGKNSFIAGSGLDGSKSDLVGAIAFQPNDSVRLTYQARVEEDLSRINVQEASLGLTFDRISGSLSYADIAAAKAYGRVSNQEQVWGDVNYSLGEAWSLFGSFRYDIEDSRFMNKSIGIAFDCDCMNARLTYSEGRDRDDVVDHSLKLSVELRTIGSMAGGFKF
ncbi:MAG: LPS-assembly protein LptD [Alphaproteobacteria bacterium]|nr:LPS-assembly protein LptD [Alphaproteobacteria bacterium]